MRPLLLHKPAPANSSLIELDLFISTSISPNRIAFLGHNMMMYSESCCDELQPQSGFGYQGGYVPSKPRLMYTDILSYCIVALWPHFWPLLVLASQSTHQASRSWRLVFIVGDRHQCKLCMGTSTDLLRVSSIKINALSYIPHCFPVCAALCGTSRPLQATSPRQRECRSCRN